MPPSRATQVRYAISQLRDVDPLERKMAIADFMQKSHVRTESTATGNASASVSHDRFQSPAEFNAPPAESAQAKPSESAESQDPLHFLNEIPIRALAEALAEEHPQTVAIVLASMQPQVAARLLENLPSSACKLAIQRLARITEIPTQALQEISAQLQSLVEKVRPAESAAGSKSLASILNHLNGSQRAEILSGLAGEHPNLVADLDVDVESAARTIDDEAEFDELETVSIASSTHVQDTFEPSEPTESSQSQEQLAADFSVIEKLPADAIRRVLAEVDVQIAINCVCGMDPRTVQRVLALLPRDQSREVHTRLKQVQHLELREIDRAQAEVYSVAVQLAEAGKLPELKLFPQTRNKLSVAA